MTLMRSPAFLGAVAMTAILAVYVAFVAQYAFILVRSDEWVSQVFGAAMFVLPAIGVWYLIVEWRLGFTVQRMGRQLEEQGRLPAFVGEQTPQGRLTEEAAEAAFANAKALVDANPEDWEAWFTVAYAYDEARDRSMARRSLKHAAQLYRKASR
ncbi:hypothetical protein ON058_08095 [Demequina sp. B12]|uniref:hypothetical protein n=1 Tax=Demequina sp. B12 TaxID=2992757 RepID=UPI00237B1F49|nr:hypothetical protein [Demequina sp. B12]MDE0573374.1 hypothetical protein [Demequina sp. B12]